MKPRILTILFLTALTANLVFLGNQVYHSLGVKSDVISTLPADNTIVYKADANATDDVLSDKSNAATNITLNSNPTFADGKARGDLMIVNSKSSKCPQIVNIYTVSGNKLVYSGGLAAGQVIEKSTLLTDLPKGTYPCFAVFYTVDADGACHLSPYSTGITITVLS